MKFANLIKNLIPLKTLYLMKYRSQMLHKKELDIPQGGPRVFLLDSPHYGNIGDQAIAYAICKFAQTHFPNHAFVDIQQEQLAYYIEDLKKKISPDDIIFLVGGGNMGNIYRIFEATRRVVLQQFPNNKIVIFPQTLDYTADVFGRLSVKMSQRVYNRHSSLTLLAREEASYHKMQQLYPRAKVILCPDIVLSLEVTDHKNSREGIGVCLRKDYEQRITKEESAQIYRELAKTGKKVYETTTTAKVGYITPDSRQEIVLSKINEISKYELLVTDRLHAMIFAFLSRTPCIAFNNSNGKIEGVYRWIRNSKSIRMVNSLAEFSEAMRSVQCDDFDTVDNQRVFKQLAESIRGV